MDFKTRKFYYNRCDPAEALLPDDPRCVDLDAGDGPRGAGVVDALAREIESVRQPITRFLTGVPGAGLSTELNRLAARLRDPGRANLLPVIVDAAEVFDLTSPLALADTLLAAWAGAHKALAGDATEAGPSGYFAQAWREAAGRAAPDLQAVVAELRTNASLRARLRRVVSYEAGRFESLVREELVLLQARARRAGRAGLVVLFDSLERLRGLSTNASEVAASAERLFLGEASRLELPIHAVYTVPPALLARAARFDLRILPMIRVAERDGQPSAAGHRAAWELCDRRVPEGLLRALLGPSRFEERFARLVTESAGAPRALVRLLRDLLLLDQEPVAQAAFERVLAEAGESHRLSVPLEAHALLAGVAESRALPLAPGGDPALAGNLLASGAILPYRDAALWFGLPPAVRRLLETSPARTPVPVR